MGDRNLFGHIEDALKGVGKGISAVRSSEIVEMIARLDPQFRAEQDQRAAQRQQTRQAQAFQLKRDELLAKSREKLEKQRADAQAQKEQAEREAEETRQKDAFSDLGEILATRTEPEAFPQPLIPTVPGLPGPMQPPQLAVAPPQDTAAGVTLGVEEAAQRAGLGAAAVGRLLGERFPEAETPKFQIKQKADGEFVLIPTTPGVPAARTGVMGETGRGKTTIQNIMPSAVTKTTKTFLERNIIEAEDRLIQIDSLMEGFDESFNTTFFQIGAGLENRLDRFPKVKGIVEPALAKAIPAEMRAKFEDFYEFAFQVDEAMFKARKEITGVAGGPVEMTRIERFLPNIDHDSPKRFRSKVRAQRLLTQKLIEHYKELRLRGIDDTAGMTEKQALEQRTNTVLGFARQAQREVRSVERSNLSPEEQALQLKFPGLREATR